MSERPLSLILVLLLCLLVAYCIEVLLGSSAGMCSSELNQEIDRSPDEKMSNKEFFFRFLPLLLALFALLWLLAPRG